MLDSGGAYGRHHEQPPVAVDSPDVSWDPTWEDCPATIETAHFLSEAFTMRDDLNAKFDEWVGEQEGSWFECGDRFMREQGYYCHVRGNVCNGENDLSQVYVYEVWTQNEDEGDWVWADDAVAAIYVHTGCDIRGGYTMPYFAESNGSYTVPFDLSASYYIADSHTLDEDARRRIDEQWECGYSDYPFGQLRDRVKRWFPWTFTKTSRVVLLDTGDVVRVVAHMPYLGG
jgi:hypothetical protein